jgi:hypothetical protein
MGDGEGGAGRRIELRFPWDAVRVPSPVANFTLWTII